MSPGHSACRRRAALGALLLAAAGAAAAAAPADTPVPALADKGFSYFLGLARQDVRYKETGGFLPFRSEARSSSPLLITGALYAVTADLLFSIDSESTFYPGRSTETWRSTSPQFNGVTLTSPVLQTNGFSLNQTQLQLLMHQRISGPWFGNGGLVLRTQSFKRFSFEPGPDGVVATPGGATVEESSGEVLLQLGLALESEQVRQADRHYGLRVGLGVPVWRRVENTSVPTLQFNGARGWDLALEGRYSIAVRPNVHVGAWAKWALAQRARQSAGLHAELPESRQQTRAFGLELLWKL